jgi:hypothetical protein
VPGAQDAYIANYDYGNGMNGRDDWIRTSDLTHPKRARYQAAPRPDKGFKYLWKISIVN